MTKHFFKKVVTEKGFQTNILATTDTNGKITSIESFDKAPEDSKTHDSLCIPGMINSHSHSFQYAMAGLGEAQTGDTSK